MKACDLKTSWIEDSKYPELDVETVAEYIWRSVNGRMPRDQIDRIVSEVAQEFETAPIRAFVPALVQRLSLERVCRDLSSSEGSQALELSRE